MSQSKNEYYFSGAILMINPVDVREYTDKHGEKKESRERTVVVRNKYSRYGRWQITDATFHCSGKAVEALELMYPGLEVILDFTIKAIWYTPKSSTEEKSWQKLECRKIMSPSDKAKPSKWWADKGGAPSTKKKVKEEEEADKATERLSEQAIRENNPEDKAYNVKDYDRKMDYSGDEPTEAIYDTPKPKEEVQEDLPF